MPSRDSFGQSRWRPHVVYLVALVAMATTAFAGESAWQSSATGTTEGALCSLVLRVKVGDGLQLEVSGGSADAGWRTLRPCVIPLGLISPGNDQKPSAVDRSGDWSGGKAVATFGDAKVTLHAGQLSPGIVIETSGDRLVLLAGRVPRMGASVGGKLEITSMAGQRQAEQVAATPAWIAVGGDSAVKVSAASQALRLPPDGAKWLLLWWGEASHFIHTEFPLAVAGPWDGAYLADCPLLVVFDKPPTVVAPAKDGGLEFTFAEAGRRLALVPIFGAAHPRADVTDKWGQDLPKEVADKCRTLAAYARKYPVSVRESFAYEAAADTATFTEKVAFLDIGPGGKTLAPLPPMAALAMQQGFAVSPGATLATLPVVTDFGPVVGAEDTDTVAWTVKGLGKYAKPPSAPAGTGKAPPELEAEFSKRLDEMLKAGQLAPWCYADNIPISNNRGEYYWGEPGEVLYHLAELHAAAAPEQQKALADYMGELCKAHPPATTPIIPPDAGARRGGYDPWPSNLPKLVVPERDKRVTLFSIYGFERYLAATQGKPDGATWAACKKVIDGSLEENAWATLYLLGHGDRHNTIGGDRKQYPELAPTVSWRGDRPATIVNVNRRFAGAVGAVRLARLAGDKSAEQEAWRFLARTAVARFALGKYAQWRYGAGLAVLPPKPDWYWQYKVRSGAGSWHGTLETNRWVSPADDVRQVVRFALDEVELDDKAGPLGERWHEACSSELAAFRHLTPELAAFLGDHLKAETAAIAARVEWNQPTWYASFTEAILGSEHNMNHPSDPYEMFLVRGWVLGERPERLKAWLDVPWLARGDLFYLHKLAETIKAYRSPPADAPSR